MIHEENSEAHSALPPNIELNVLSHFRVLLSRFQRFFSDKLIQKNSEVIEDFLENSSKAYQEILASCLADSTRYVGKRGVSNDDIMRLINSKIIWEACHIVYIQKKNCKSRELVDLILSQDLLDREKTDSSRVILSFPHMFAQANSFGPSDPKAELEMKKYWGMDQNITKMSMSKRIKNPFLDLYVEQKTNEIQSLLNVIADFAEKKKIIALKRRAPNLNDPKQNFSAMVAGQTQIKGGFFKYCERFSDKKMRFR